MSPARDRHAGHAHFASDCRLWYARPCPAALAACMDRPSWRAIPCISSRSPHTSGMACFSAFERAFLCCTDRHRRRFRSVGALRSACAAAEGHTMGGAGTGIAGAHRSATQNRRLVRSSPRPCASRGVLGFSWRRRRRPPRRSERRTFLWTLCRARTVGTETA